MSYLPFHIHSSLGSRLDGFIFADKLSKRLSDYNIGSCMLSDHGSMSYSVEFNTELISKGIKPIIGNEFYFSHGPASEKSELNRKASHMVICATSKNGYKNLCNLTTKSNSEEFYYYKPRLDLNILKTENISDLLFFTGHYGSLLHHVLSQVSPAEHMSVGEFYLNKLIDIVGKNNLYLEIQRICCKDDPYADLLNRLAKRVGIKAVACIDAHYVDRADAHNQRLLLASSLQTTLKKYKRKLEDNPLISFFNNDYYHLPSFEEIKEHHTDEEIKNSLEISDRCENFSLKGNPILPKFSENEEQELRQLCRDGWKNILVKKNVLNDSNLQIYKDRVEYELQVISEFGLSGYFLIVQDFIKYARNQGSLAVPRGSAGASLVSYLSNITYTDPIANNLMFSRFLNKGRFTENNIEYPDIDVDFPPSIREKVVSYIRAKYKEENVAQICNFGTLKGAGALKEVLRMHEVCSFIEMNEITKYIPNEAAISDQLEEQQEESILMFVLKNMPATVESYCKYNDGEFTGEFAEYFKQAIEIEGAVKNQGVHAAGLVISPTPLSEFCPLNRSKDGQLICSYDMKSVQKIGLVKMDLLNTQVLEKLMYVNKLLNK